MMGKQHSPDRQTDKQTDGQLNRVTGMLRLFVRIEIYEDGKTTRKTMDGRKPVDKTRAKTVPTPSVVYGQ